jgi:hypothetical protein
MNTRQSQLYLARSCASEDHEACGGGDDGYVADMRPEEAAEYIASMLSSLRSIAVKAEFPLLSDLISVAEEEAKFHFPA